MIRAVLFDVGGPLDLEIEHERRVDAAIRTALTEAGIAVSDDVYAAWNAAAVAAFAPDAYRAIIWAACAAHEPRARAVYARFRELHPGAGAIQVRPGIADVLARLAERGLKLGLAANQPASAIGLLDAAGLGRFFQHREVSGHHGYRKPDVRIFLRACDDLGVAPAETVMVGDRVDNDIAPARRLGMGAVLLRTGRHIAQQPRDWDETPHATVTDAPGILRAVLALAAAT